MTRLIVNAGRSRFRGRRRAVHYAAAVMLSLLAMHAVPVIAQETTDDTPTSVSPPQLPTEVTVGAYLIGLSQVSEPSDPFPTVDLEVFLNLSWLDPRLASDDENGPPRIFQEEEAEEKLSEISLLPNDAQTGFDVEFQTPEWKVTAVEGLIGTGMEVRDDREFSNFMFRIHAERQSGHYLLRLFLPLFFVMAATWLAFWEPAAERYRIGFFALLTVVAMHAIIAGNLPRLDYPTLADMVLIFCYVTAIAVIAIGLIVRRIEAAGNVKRARVIDRYSVWLLPAIIAIVLSVAALILWN